MAKTIIGLAVFGLIIYIIVMLGLPVYNYHVFKSDLSETSTWDTDVRISDKLFKEKVLKYAEDSSIPISEEDIEVFQDGDERDIAVSWSETVNLFNIYQKTYEYTIDTRGEE
ncbi:MAG TPA: hypothetical protein VJL89_11900 [Thermodesulfovibrionia bacterium]|nr:hypothetical protein [Thermodesulfovibrionia bacterium]